MDYLLLVDERESLLQCRWRRERPSLPVASGVKERISNTGGQSEREGKQRTERAGEGKGSWVFSEENEIVVLNSISISFFLFFF